MKKGFTILEMILVLTVIAVIVLITLPNVTQKKKVINEVGCKALVEVVNSQILTYELDGGSCSSIDQLVNSGFLKPEQTSCPDGRKITIVDGKAVAE